MRKIYLSFLTVWLLNLTLNFAGAQSIPPTNGGGLLCGNCVPPGWTQEDGWPGQSTHIHLNQSTVWTPALPFPPSGHGVGGSLFMSLESRSLYHDATANTTITGLEPGKGYKLTYYVLSAKSTESDYGEDITVTVNYGLINSFSQSTIFSAENDNLDKWIKKELVFTAAGTTASVKVKGASMSDFYKYKTVAIDIESDAVQPCNAGTEQVSLGSYTASTTCPTNKFNLNSLVIGQMPPGIEVRWFTNPEHSGFKYLSPQAAAPGKYYAFYYDTVNNCYNTDNSTAAVTVTGLLCAPCNAGSTQVTLSTNKTKNICPATLVDLKPLVTNVAPPGSVIVFYSTPNHLPGTMIPEVQMTGKIYVFTSGTYYAFFYDSVNECFNTDNSTAAVAVTITTCPPPCSAGADQVALNGAFKNNICPATTVDITKAIANVPPQGLSVVWYTNPNHTGNPYPNPATAVAGNYYAFFYDAVNDCFNTDNSTAKVTAVVNACPPPCNAGVKQVALNRGTLSTGCPSQKVDLNIAYTGIVPNAVSLVWFTNATHSGLPYATPHEAVAGTYYAFFYDAVNNCYNTNNSTAILVVTNILCPPCNATTEQVVLSATTIKNVCPSTIVDLKPLYQDAVPNGATLVFYSTANHQPGTMIPEVVINGQGKINVSASGTYYAFFFDQINNCFNAGHSSAKVTVTIDDCTPVCNAGTKQVSLNTSETSNICPATTAVLSNTLTDVGNYPPFAEVRWFTNPNHTGNQYPTPQQATAGDYYAFFYDVVNDCYNTDNSTAKVTVTINPCIDKVELSVKAYLLGAMHASLPQMRNDLQTYLGNNLGLISETDPYGSGLFVPNINNIVVSAEIVDWIKVEIRSAADPSIILETQSLFLRPSGLITNADNTKPKFSAQAEPVRIVLKHRNHVAIMSNSIATFGSGPVTYDFTTSLAQAYNDGSAPDQMKLANGVWCMINGDPNQNLSLESQDINQTRNAFNQGVEAYSARDLNMNGVVENQDMNIQRNRFNDGCFSILINL